MIMGFSGNFMDWGKSTGQMSFYHQIDWCFLRLLPRSKNPPHIFFMLKSSMNTFSYPLAIKRDNGNPFITEGFIGKHIYKSAIFLLARCDHWQIVVLFLAELHHHSLAWKKTVIKWLFGDDSPQSFTNSPVTSRCEVVIPHPRYMKHGYESNRSSKKWHCQITGIIIYE